MSCGSRADAPPTVTAIDDTATGRGDGLPENDLVVVLTYYLPYVSGLTDVARDLAEGLAARGWRVCVVASKHDPALPTEDEVNGVRIVRAPVLARVGKGTLGVNLTRLALREMRRSRVVNLHLPLIEAGLLARLSPAPVVSTYHCDVTLPAGAVNRAQQQAVDLSNRIALRRSARVVVTSEDYARHSRLWPSMGVGRVAIPPPCVPRSQGRATFRSGPGLHVGFLGRIVEEKGLEFLVDAFLALDDPDARLLIAGDFVGVAGGSVVDRVRAHIHDDERVTMLGFLPEERLRDFYASLDVFALPSVNAFEAFGIVQVVAMQAGVPAVVSDLPGVRVPVRTTGFGEVVAPRDVPGLTAALARIRDTPPDRAAGRAAAVSEFSVGAVLDAYESVFVTSGRGGPVRGGNRVGIDEVARTWTRLGREDPLWAVLTDRGRSGGGWGSDEFLATGEQEVRTLLERLAAAGLDPARGRAVDFGCGAGRLSHGLAVAGFAEVIGLDISPTMRAKAEEIVPDEACRFRAVEGPGLEAVETGSVDLVYTCRVLQHMPPDLAHGYIREFYRVARPGAVVVFQMPTEPADGLAGTALRMLPRPVAVRLRRGMEMHGTPEPQTQELLGSVGAELVAADADASAGPRWNSRLYLTRAPG